MLSQNRILSRLMFNNNNINDNNLNDDYHINRSQTFDLLKSGVHNLNEYNRYITYYNSNNLDYADKSRALRLYNILEGNIKFYNVNLFTDIANNLVDNLTQEVFSDLKIILNDKIVNQIEMNDVSHTFQIDDYFYKKMFKNLYVYEEVLVQYNYESGEAFVFKPFEYIQKDDEYYHVYFNSGEAKEVLLPNSFILTYETRFYNRMELILNYEMLYSSLSKEVILNQSKIFVDVQAFKSSNITQTELINLINVPKSVAIDSGNDKAKYIDVYQGKNTLGDIIASVREAELKLVNAFKLSKKTLGLDSSGTDFATSLPYENDMTAKTINSIRSDMSRLIERLLFTLTKRRVMVDLGRYELDSTESIVDVNQKAISSNQMSIQTAVARRLDLPVDSDEVLYETLAIKIEKNITLTLSEDQEARHLGLLPSNNTIIIDSDV